MVEQFFIRKAAKKFYKKEPGKGNWTCNHSAINSESKLRFFCSGKYEILSMHFSFYNINCGSLEISIIYSFL